MGSSPGVVEVATFHTDTSSNRRIVLWSVAGAFAFAFLGLALLLIISPGGSRANLALGLSVFGLVLLYIGGVAVNWAFTGGSPGASRIVVSASGIELTFPNRPPWMIEWAHPGRGFRIVRSYGSPGRDGSDETSLEGFWKPVTYIPCAQGEWLLSEAQRRGLQVSAGRRSSKYPSIRIVVYAIGS